MDQVALFARSGLTGYSNSLAGAFSCTAQRAVQEIQALGPDELLKVPNEEVVERLVKRGSVRCPRLIADQAEQLDPTEVDKTEIQFGERVTRRVTRLVLAVPYEGERDIFLLRADTSSPNNPRVLQLTDREIHFAVDEPPSNGAQIKTMFDAQIAHVGQYLEWSRQQIDAHNQRIRDEVPRMVEARREQLQATRNLQEETGFPIREAKPS